MLLLQVQQEQRRSSSLNDELKAAKTQNVHVVGILSVILLSLHLKIPLCKDKAFMHAVVIG